MVQRNAYLLHCNPNSERTLFSKNLLEKVGFTVIMFPCIPHTDPLTSNRLSMIAIYTRIKEGNDEWAYVFEDDINIIENIHLNEIIQYENISSMFFYLGVCYDISKIYSTSHTINKHPIMMISGFNHGGLHAIGISKTGAEKFLEFINGYYNIYIDQTLARFSIHYPAHIVRFDLESYIEGHRGIFFQDRDRFPSSI
jgi:hypothetical protein